MNEQAKAIVSLLAAIQDCRDKAPDVYHLLAHHEPQIKCHLRVAWSRLNESQRVMLIVQSPLLPIERRRAKARMGRRNMTEQQKGLAISKLCKYINT